MGKASKEILKAKEIHYSFQLLQPPPTPVGLPENLNHRLNKASSLGGFRVIRFMTTSSFSSLQAHRSETHLVETYSDLLLPSREALTVCRRDKTKRLRWSKHGAARHRNSRDKSFQVALPSKIRKGGTGFSGSQVVGLDAPRSFD